jgi:OOP family OmpA-OmpF porin
MFWNQRWQAVALSAFLGGSALAAAPSNLPALDMDRFSFNPAANNSLVLQGGELNAQGTFRFSFAGELLDDANLNRDETGFTNYRLTRKIVRLSGAYTATNWLQLNFELPFVVFQNGASALQSNNFNLPVQSGTGTPLVAARFGLLKQSEGKPVSLALEAKVGLPFGSGTAATRDLRMPLMPTISVGRDFGQFRVDGQVNATFRAQQTMEVVSGNKDDLYTHEIGGGVGVSGMIPNVPHLRGELNTQLSVALKNPEVAVQTFAGLRYGLDQSGTEVFLGGGPAFGNLIGVPKFLLVGGMAFGGGTSNQAKTLAEAPKKQEPVVAQVVCDHSKPHELTQCPMLDDDGDGIANGQDKCPTAMGPASNLGCPVPEAPKAVVIEKKPEPVVEKKPEIADADGDGIPDDQDTCPTLAGPASNHGCPADQKQMVVITNDKLQILDKIYFKGGSAKIDPKSFRLLDQIAAVIKDHPHLAGIEVGGHTDNKGSAAKNLKLSQNRANSVRQYLIEKGHVDANKVLAKGYGAEKPIDTNLTAMGREANRRVEFTIESTQTMTTQNIPVQAPAKNTVSAKGKKKGAVKAANNLEPAPLTPAPAGKTPAAAPAPKK